VTLEILKYVSTKIEAKQLFEKQEQQQNPEKKSNSKRRIPTPLSWLRRSRHNDLLVNSDETNEKWRSFFLHYLETHCQSLLTRFRNCFINLSTNDISFVQPVEKQKTIVNEFLSFHLWEGLSFSQKEININTMTIKELLNYFRKVYDVEITSILYEGRVVYHSDLLIGEKEEEEEKEEEKSLRETLNDILRSEEQEEEEEEINAEADENEDKDYFEHEKLLRLEITVIPLKKTITDHLVSTSEVDRTIPPVVLEFPSPPSSNTRKKGFKKMNPKKNRLFSKWFSRSKR
jgi:hypothetical protein